MTLLKVCHRGSTPSADGKARAYSASIQVGDLEVATTVRDPRANDHSARLDWYFAEHIRFPFLDEQAAYDAEERIKEVGKALFDQIFGALAHREIGMLYEKLKNQGFNDCEIVISGPPEFHDLPWETMCDATGEVLAVRVPITRQLGAAAGGQDALQIGTTLNILLVTARPDGVADVAYRTIAQPLVEMLNTSDFQIKLDLVRPATYRELETRLAHATKAHGAGYYQIVHLDMHGVFHREGPPNVTGAAAVFESCGSGGADVVPAAKLAHLIAEHQVSMVITNACDSAAQSTDQLSLAQELVKAGVPPPVLGWLTRSPSQQR